MSSVEELCLMTDDSETLVAWHVPPREGRPLILYFHGNGGALVDRVPRFRMFGRECPPRPFGVCAEPLFGAWY